MGVKKACIQTPSPKTSFQQIVALLQPTPDGGLVACILVREAALEKSFFSWDHNRRHEADSWHERYEQPEIIQSN